jgi:hypothetical protein
LKDRDPVTGEETYYYTYGLPHWTNPLTGERQPAIVDGEVLPLDVPVKINGRWYLRKSGSDIVCVSKTEPTKEDINFGMW